MLCSLNSQFGSAPVSTLCIIANGVVSSETDPGGNGSAKEERVYLRLI